MQSTDSNTLPLPLLSICPQFKAPLLDPNYPSNLSLSFSQVSRIINMGHKKLVVASFILTLFLFNTMLVLSEDGEVEDEKEFNYEEGGEIGPERWGEIHEEWALCGNGTMQSPIDLSDDRVTVLPDLGPLQRSYRPAPAILKNRGHDIMLRWEDDAGSIWINKIKYSLKQLHWHSPTEHSVNGCRYSLEMHMVHESAEKQIAVVGILYRIGRRDSLLAEMEKYINKLRDKDEVEVGTVDPRHIDLGGLSYYRYMGSLTTPPCSEGVVWTVVQKVLTVSIEQVQLLREAVHDGFDMNARPIQKINGRMIGLYRPKEVQSF